MKNEEYESTKATLCTSSSSVDNVNKKIFDREREFSMNVGFHLSATSNGYCCPNAFFPVTV